VANYTLKILFIFFAINAFVKAASCCGGGAGASAIVTSDDRAKIFFNYKNSAYIYDVDKDKNISKRSRNEAEVLETFRLGGAYLFDNYLQLAASSTISKITKETGSLNESSTNIADTSLSVGYEFLKERYFSYWKPRGFIYFSQTIPTGNSKYEAEKPLQTDVTGGGFHQSKVGLTFYKLIKEYDFTFDTGLSYYFKERFEEVSVERYPSAELSFAFGYSPKMGAWRVGSGVSFKYDGHSELTFNDGRYNESEGVLLSTVNLSTSYMANTISYTLIYSDQTLLTTNRNTSLERALSFNLSKSFPL
jgi:hypothetical protein